MIYSDTEDDDVVLFWVIACFSFLIPSARCPQVKLYYCEGLGKSRSRCVPCSIALLFCLRLRHSASRCGFWRRSHSGLAMCVTSSRCTSTSERSHSPTRTLLFSWLYRSPC